MIRSHRQAICAFDVVFRKPVEKFLDDGCCMIRLMVGSGGRHGGGERDRLLTGYASGGLRASIQVQSFATIHSRANEPTSNVAAQQNKMERWIQGGASGLIAIGRVHANHYPNAASVPSHVSTAE